MNLRTRIRRLARSCRYLGHSRIAIIAVLALGCSACPATPQAPTLQVRLAVDDGALDQVLTQRWMEALKSRGDRVAVDKPVHLSVWQERVQGNAVLYLGVAWPAGWIRDPHPTPLLSPVKLGLVLEGPAASPEQYARGLARLLELFWVQVELAQSAWPIPERYLYEPYPVAVRSMTADWLGRKGKPHLALAQGCLALLRHALIKPRRPELERLESSVACLAKVATAKELPSILDAMPNGHLRVEMARVELLGELGGSLAIDHLRWVHDQAQEDALVRAAELALKRWAQPAS